MLINRIHRSMDLVLEGVDNCQPELLLEASKEFETGVQELAKNIEQFVGICKSFREIKTFVGGLEFYLEDIKEALKDMDKIPDEYSFEDHYKLQTNLDPKTGKPIDEESGDVRRRVSQAALEYPTYVGALRDTIMEIAEWLENFPEIFSVGKNGIVFSGDFGPYVLNKEIRVKDFANDDGLQVLQAITNEGGDKKEEEIKVHFEEMWKKEDISPEKYDDEWTKFKDAFGKIGSAGKAAFDTARKNITDAQPPKVVKKAGNDGGGILKNILGGLLGDSAPEEYEQYSIMDNPSFIVGESLTDDLGIFSMTFSDLQALVVKVIELASSAEAAGARGLAAVDAQNRDTMDPSKNQLKLMAALKDVSNKLDTETITHIGAILYDLDPKGMKKGDWSSIDRKTAKDYFIDIVFEGDEEKTNAVVSALFGESDEGADGDGGGDFLSDIDDKTKLAKQLKKYLKDPQYPDVDENIDTYHDLIKSYIQDGNLADPSIKQNIEDENLVNDDLGVHFAKGKGFTEMHSLITLGKNDELFQFFKGNSEGLQEMKLILRWGRLAGIIKD